MNSRDKILGAVGQNQPVTTTLPDISVLHSNINNPVVKFADTLTAIGGTVIPVKSIAGIRSFLLQNLAPDSRKITMIPQFDDMLEPVSKEFIDPHSMQNVDYAILEAKLAVAENGAVWVTEDILQWRIVPFICQHLIVVVNANDIVADMHRAYDKIGGDSYGFGTFIAGPSKTADIEQSLVLGAHGPRSMTVLLVS